MCVSTHGHECGSLYCMCMCDSSWSYAAARGRVCDSSWSCVAAHDCACVAARVCTAAHDCVCVTACVRVCSSLWLDVCAAVRGLMYVAAPDWVYMCGSLWS